MPLEGASHKPGTPAIEGPADPLVIPEAENPLPHEMHEVGCAARVLKMLKFPDGSVRVLVEGVRIIKKHMRKSQDNPQGKIAEREGPIHISNVKLIEQKEKPAKEKKKKESKAKA